MTTNARPPRFGRALLGRIAPPEDFQFISGDLDEEFQRRFETLGKWRASWWYTWQVILSVPAFISLRRTYRDRHSHVSTPMLRGFRSDLRDAIRRARRAPLGPVALAVP